MAEAAVLVLASASPRRLDLLVQAGFRPVVRPADVDETWHDGEDADAYVLRVASSKALAVSREAGEVVIAADTAVVLDGHVLGKPRDDQHAAHMLRALSGRAHQVVTAVVVVGTDGRVQSRVVRTTVAMRPISDVEIREYVASQEPRDKAGAYAIQGGAAAFVERFDGSWSNVVGLPVDETMQLLERASVRAVMTPRMEWGSAGNG